jgi:putative ATPase
MKDLGYGTGYRYDPEETEGVAPQTYLPARLEGSAFYEPGPFGNEVDIRERLEWWAEKKDAARRAPRDPDRMRDPGT